MIISVFDTVENIVGKGENVGYQHFLPFPQYFEKASFPDKSKGVTVWECVNSGRNHLDVSDRAENIVGKKRKCWSTDDKINVT